MNCFIGLVADILRGRVESCDIEFGDFKFHSRVNLSLNNFRSISWDLRRIVSTSIFQIKKLESIDEIILFLNNNSVQASYTLQGY